MASASAGCGRRRTRRAVSMSFGALNRRESDSHSSRQPSLPAKRQYACYARRSRLSNSRWRHARAPHCGSGVPGGITRRRAVDRRPHRAEAHQRHAGDFSRWPSRRLRGAGDQLGRQRLRDRDLGRRCAARPAAPVRSPAPPSRASQPAWSPDGKWVAFISDRSDTRQLYRLSVEGGEAEVLTSGTEGVTAFAWSPEGARIAYTMTDPVTAAHEGTRGEVRRVHARGSRPSHGAAARAGRGDQGHARR